jgi:hypothetical protein
VATNKNKEPETVEAPLTITLSAARGDGVVVEPILLTNIRNLADAENILTLLEYARRQVDHVRVQFISQAAVEKAKVNGSES